jgi:hypothetical protein
VEHGRALEPHSSAEITLMFRLLARECRSWHSLCLVLGVSPLIKPKAVANRPWACHSGPLKGHPLIHTVHTEADYRPLGRPSPRLATRIAGLGLLALASCATYAENTEDALGAFQRGDVDDSVSAYRDAVDSNFLRGAEAGTVLLAAGRWSEARAEFERAQRAVNDIEEQALISAEDLTEKLGSWFWNDTVQTYQGEGFERVYLHMSLALTYLAEGKLQSVFVETRLANKLLESEEGLYEKEYKAGGLGHFISAITYELMGEYDEAYIDYKRMAEKGVGLGVAGPALVRIAKKLHRDDELPAFEARFGASEAPPADAASIVVIAGVGLGPYKEEKGIAVESWDGLIKIVAPTLRRRSQSVGDLRLVLQDGGGSLRTAVVEEVSDVAEENLNDRIVMVTAKSVARTFAKREMTKQLQDDHGIFGRLVGDVFSAATERADLRFWQTLPDTYQAARMFVSPGEHGIELQAGPAGTADLGRFLLEPGETLVILARTVDYQLFANVIGGTPVAAVTPAATPAPKPTNEPVENMLILGE